MKYIMNFTCGLLFSFGLLISGMCDIEVVKNFFALKDPTLLFVMASGLIVTTPFFYRWRMDKVFQRPCYPIGPDVNRHFLIFGSATSGIGWAIVGMTPCSIVVLSGTGSSSVLYALLTYIIGTLFAQLIIINAIRYPTDEPDIALSDTGA